MKTFTKNMTIFEKKVSETHKVKPCNDAYEGTKYSCPLLPKSVIACGELNEKNVKGLRFFTTLGSDNVEFYIIFRNKLVCEHQN